MKDYGLARLIMESDELMRRMDRIRSGDKSLMLHLREIQQWAEDAEQWASSTGVAIPERKTDLISYLALRILPF